MKKLLVSLAALAAVAGAQAATVVTIDDFNAPDMLVSDPLTAGATTASDAVRTVDYTLLAGPADGNGSTLTIGSGTFPVGLLEVANASGRDSSATITWNLSALNLPANATNVGFFLQVVQSDGNPTSLAFSLGGSSVANFTIDPNTMNEGKSFVLTAAQVAQVAAGGQLALTIDGDTGWDLTIDQFGISYDVPVVSVPEPASLALLGLGLAGAALARRRKA